jgi:hypothetical protein
VNAKNPSSCPAKSTTTRGVAFTAASASALALVVALALASAPAERRIASDARANVEPLAVDIAIDRRGRRDASTRRLRDRRRPRASKSRPRRRRRRRREFAVSPSVWCGGRRLSGRRIGAAFDAHLSPCVMFSSVYKNTHPRRADARDRPSRRRARRPHTSTNELCAMSARSALVRWTKQTTAFAPMCVTAVGARAYSTGATTTTRTNDPDVMRWPARGRPNVIRRAIERSGARVNRDEGRTRRSWHR